MTNGLGMTNHLVALGMGRTHRLSVPAARSPSPPVAGRRSPADQLLIVLDASSHLTIAFLK